MSSCLCPHMVFGKAYETIAHSYENVKRTETLGQVPRSSYMKVELVSFFVLCVDDYNTITPQYVILVGVTVLGAVLGAGFVGRFVGFNAVESSITAGLCMANIGGTGDVAVLSASKRMGLMPFVQISSRLGGAFILILASVVLKFFG